jgi:hypothetical protein
MGYRFLTIGIVVLLIGLHLRMVDTFVLTPKASHFVEAKIKRMGRTTNPYAYDSVLLTAGPVPKKSITPPRWLGLALISVGAILIFHGVSLRGKSE